MLCFVIDHLRVAVLLYLMHLIVDHEKKSKFYLKQIAWLHATIYKLPFDSALISDMVLSVETCRFMNGYMVAKRSPMVN